MQPASQGMGLGLAPSFRGLKHVKIVPDMFLPTCHNKHRMPASKFDNTRSQNIRELMGGDMAFDIPEYQRDYSWSESKADDLWQDMLASFYRAREGADGGDGGGGGGPGAARGDDGQYLLGPLVLSRDPGLADSYLVIDGQQRLATLTMLFCIARDLIYMYADRVEGQNPEGIEELRRMIEVRRMGRRVRWRVALGEKDARIFDEIQGYDGPDGRFVSPDERIERWREERRREARDPAVAGAGGGGGGRKHTQSVDNITANYRLLYGRLHDCLVTGFDRDRDAGSVIRGVRESLRGVVDGRVRGDPVGAGLDAGFFDRLQRLESREFTEGEVVTYRREVDNKNRQNPDKSVDMDGYIGSKIERMKRELERTKDRVMGDVERDTVGAMCRANLGGLTGFVDHVCERMYVMRLVMDDDADAFQAFETLNERGAQLSNSALIKNHVLRQVQDRGERRGLGRRWTAAVDEVFVRIEDRDSFLYESLYSRMLEEDPAGFSPFPKNRMYRAAKERITGAAGAERFVGMLEEDSRVASVLDEGVAPGADPTVLSYVHMARLLRAQNIRIPMMIGWRRWYAERPGDYRRLVVLLVRMFFKHRVVLGASADLIERVAVYAARCVVDGGGAGVVDAMVDGVIGMVGDGRDEFVRRFEALHPQDNVARYMLHEITTSMGDPHADVRPIDGLTLEHVLPKNPDPASWPREAFFRGVENPAQIDQYVRNVGNLTLLKGDVNTAIGNLGFVQKRDHKDADGRWDGYRSSNLRINERTVVCEDEWTALTIEGRARVLAEHAGRVWDLRSV